MEKVNLSVGQTVFIKTEGNAARGGVRIIETVITKIGTKNFEVEHSVYGCVKYSLANMMQLNSTTSNGTIYTDRQQIENELRAYELLRKFREVFTTPKAKLITLTQLESIEAILTTQ